MRLAIMGAVLSALVGFFLMIAARMTEPDMSLLYADLDPADRRQIVSRLEGMGVPVDIKGGGSQLYVPSNQVARIRMLMAEVGLPSGGSIGYEIFDRSDNVRSTSSAQDINRLRALEGELARSIRSITNVASARVHLVMPKPGLFSHDAQQPSASVVLHMRGGRLTSSQIHAVQYLVAAAVAGLSPGHISIIDERGTLLARGDVGDRGIMIQGLEETQRAYEDRAARTIETLLERSLGPGKVRAEVRAELDRNRTIENAELYDPEGSVVRSSQSTEESGKPKEAAAGGSTGVASNVSGDQRGAGSVSSSDTTRTEETVNYEISRTIRSNTKEAGGILRLSAAVLVDGNYATAENGTQTYTPRTEEELTQLTKLVKSAVGFNEKRGDTVEVVNMRFAEPPVVESVESTDWFMGFSRHDVMRFAENIILSIIALLALLVGVKPIINRILAAITTVREEIDPALATAGAGAGVEGQASLASPTGAADTGESAASRSPGNAAQPRASRRNLAPDEHTPFGEGFGDKLERKNVIGKMKATSIKRIEGMIDDRTEESVNKVRAWLKEGVS